MGGIRFSKSYSTSPVEKRFFARGNLRGLRIIFAIAVLMIVPASVFAKTMVEWDFSKGVHGWRGNQRVEGLTASPEGLIFKSTGEDPWIEGPAVDLLGGEMTSVKIRMKSDADAGGQLFYGRVFSEGQSVRFAVRHDGKWHEYSLVVRDKLGAGTRFRLDPCSGAGEVTVVFIKVEALSKITRPSLEEPKAPNKGDAKPVSVKSGAVEFEHYGGRWGNFAVKVNGAEMAVGYKSELLGVLLDERPEWLNLRDAKVTFKGGAEGEFTSRAVVEDSGGAKWEIERHIRGGEKEGTILVETQLKVNKDRDVVHIPWLTIFPGLGTFGERKYQGLFAGLEYLCDEPSSSEADITGPEHIRRVPDAVKITFPLMAITHNGNYIGVIWEPSDIVAASFDSPDRIYNSGAHVMALSGPCVGELRFENEFAAHSPLKIKADRPLKAVALIIGGKGKTIVPAVKRYVDLKGLGGVPQFEGGFDGAVKVLGHGWLDSQINQDGLFRHAVWGSSFGPGPAADAAMFIDWLAEHSEDEKLRYRLNGARELALSKIPAPAVFSSSVSHAHLPTAPFVFGRTYEFVQQKRRQALSSLRDFDEKGVKVYRPGRMDYSKTHFAKHANGYAGRTVAAVLESAALSGDKGLIGEALELLDKQTALYADTVPRGAQTWEVPLHTPDVLASAHMVKAYTLGYIISGKQEYLEQARYWAWTGVPFVYLYPPTSGRVGPYSTIAVLGATSWKAPVWFGQPVQWCGLVYCSALHLLSECDPGGPWEKIAKGITTTGLQMTWRLTDEERQGLLPDFFDLRGQVGAGPAINPGTVQAHLAELYGKGKIYDVKKVPRRGWFISAPCAISDVREDKKQVTLTADGWGDKPYYVLISGVDKEPREVRARPCTVRYRARKVIQSSTGPPVFKPVEKEFHSDGKCLVITLREKSEIRIEY